MQTFRRRRGSNTEIPRLHGRKQPWMNCWSTSTCGRTLPKVAAVGQAVGEDGAAVRKAIVAHYERHTDWLNERMKGAGGAISLKLRDGSIVTPLTSDDSIRHMGHQGTWADDLAVAAAASVFERSIIVHKPGRLTFRVDSGQGADDDAIPIHLLLRGQHYELLLPKSITRV